MARIRSVHPGLWTDETFVGLTRDARLLLIGLWGECDDRGVFEWKPLQIKMRLCAGDDVSLMEIREWLTELTASDVAKNYSLDGKSYGVVRNFCRWQRPKKPNYTHPMPDELRHYAGFDAISSELKRDEGVSNSEPGTLSDQHGSEPSTDEQATVPNQFPTGGGKSPQREEIKEEGGGEERKKEPSSLRSDAAVREKRVRPRSQIPPDWHPTDDGLAYARDRGVNAIQEIDPFRNHHAAKGNLMADWSAAWRTWCDNQVKFGRAPGKPTPPAVQSAQSYPWGVDEWLKRRGLTETCEDDIGQTVPAIAGYMVGYLVEIVAHAAGLDPAWRGNLDAMERWIRDGVEIDSAVLLRIERQAYRMRQQDQPIHSLAVFDQTVRGTARAA